VDRVDPGLRAQLTAWKVELLAALTATMPVAAVPVAERIDGGDVQHRDVAEAVRPGVSNEHLGLRQGHAVRVADDEGFSAGHEDAKRLEGVAVQQFADGVPCGHADSIARRRVDSQNDAPIGTAESLPALAAGMPVAAGGEGFDRDDVSQTDDLNILGQGVVRLGVEQIKGKLGDEAKAGVANIERAAVREADTQGDERVAVQFICQGTGRHAESIARRRADLQSVASTGTAESLPALAAGMPVAERIDGGDVDVRTGRPTVSIGEGDEQSTLAESDRIRVRDPIGVSARQSDGERLERLPPEQVSNLVGVHNRSIARCRTDSHGDASTGKAASGDMLELVCVLDRDERGNVVVFITIYER
jgi:hypothetical protein